MRWLAEDLLAAGATVVQFLHRSRTDVGQFIVMAQSGKAKADLETRVNA